ncbi:hypothetical protein BVG18_17375 [Acinetobacter lwoffii]|uniref:hypothetical protein n=1 Tax=Acinetobacter lwoffii TaxID=28090 RepID=UPI000A32893C|nr:hypothetical protein BVG18_08530 [Acinetobacter lwoffii]QEU63732.1 hypothetical protein BVG18_17375 [Acinetobacter lwoffii]
MTQYSLPNLSWFCKKTQYTNIVQDGVALNSLSNTSVPRFFISLVDDIVLPANFDLKVRMRIVSEGGAAYGNSGITIGKRVSINNELFLILRNPFLSSGNSWLFAYTANSSSTIGISTPASQYNTKYSTAKDIWFRVKVQDNALSYAIWNDDESEPLLISAGAIPVNARGTLNSNGGLIIGHYSEKTYIIVKEIRVGTDNDAAPPSNPTTFITGTLLKPDNTPAGLCGVRVYSKKSGVLIEETTTDENGLYAIESMFPTSALVQIVGVDQDNNEWKPPIHEAYPVL